MVHRRAPASELCEALILKQESPIRFAPSVFCVLVTFLGLSIELFSFARPS